MSFGIKLIRCDQKTPSLAIPKRYLSAPDKLTIKRHKHGILYNSASDQGLHCLHTEISIRNKIKNEKTPETPKFGNGLVQLKRMEKFTGEMLVSLNFCLVCMKIACLCVADKKNNNLKEWEKYSTIFW